MNAIDAAPKWRSTTVICVRRQGKVALGSDGQVSLGATVMKANAVKIHRIFNGRILCGFAGSTADAFSLLERFENKLQKHQGQLQRAALELAKDWRQDRILRRLEAMLIVCDQGRTLLLSGTGDVIEPEQDVIAIGSGGPYALAAARALLQNSDLQADEIVQKSLAIAADICVYSNHHIKVEQLKSDE